MAFFEDTFTLSASEADLHRRMKLSAALRHMQDAASRHLDALGYPYEKLMENRQVFLLSKVEVVFSGSPAPEPKGDGLYPSPSFQRRLFPTGDTAGSRRPSYGFGQGCLDFGRL